jgi:hypothetical protein
MLLPTAVGAVKSSGSGRMPLQSLAISYLFHIVVFECQGAPDPTVRKERFSTHGIILAVGWCMRCGGGGTNLRRRSVIRQTCQTSQQLDQGRFDKKRETRGPLPIEARGTRPCVLATERGRGSVHPARRGARHDTLRLATTVFHFRLCAPSGPRGPAELDRSAPSSNSR